MQVPGRDVAGVVLESDAGSAFPPGSRVWGFVAYPSPGRNRQLHLPASGAWAEQVSLPEGGQDSGDGRRTGQGVRMSQRCGPAG